MAGLTSHNFLSAAPHRHRRGDGAGLRGQPRRGPGNFWVDLTRISLYVLLPFAWSSR